MITAEQKLLRMGKLGSSDAAAVLGLDPYRSASDVFLEKTGQADGFEGNENTERGNLFELPLIQWTAKQLNKTVVAEDTYTHPSGLLIANLDGVILCGDDVTEIVEAKTTVDPEGWGDEGTDQVPERVLAQVSHQFVCVPSAVVCWVPVLMPGFKKFDLRLYRVDRNDDLCAAVEQQGLAFMNDHVMRGIPPADFRPSLEVLKRVRRVPNKIVPIADELVERYLAACEHAKEAQGDKEKAQSYLLASLGDAEGGSYSGGAVTYMQVNRKAYTVAESSYRKLNVKKAKNQIQPQGA